MICFYKVYIYLYEIIIPLTFILEFITYSLTHSTYVCTYYSLTLSFLIVYVTLELDSLDASRLDPSLALAFYFKDRLVIYLTSH